MENTFLANLQVEGEEKINLTPELETPVTETPAAPPAEIKPSGEPASPAEGGAGAQPPKEGETPAVYHAFHEHPKWQELQTELQTLRDFREKYEPLLARKDEPGAGNESIPVWFVTLFGNNEEAYQQYQQHTSEERKQIRSEVLKEIEDRDEKKVVEQKKYDSWLDQGIKTLKEKDTTLNESELLDVVMKYRPTDDAGAISLEKAYDIYKVVKNPVAAKPNPGVSEKKQVAARTMARSGGSGIKKDYVTSHDLQGKDFATLISEGQ